MTFEGLTWCHVPADSQPLDPSSMLRAEGRWNNPYEFGCLYLSMDAAGAMAEFRKALRAGEVIGEHHLATVQINDLHPVADLTQPFTDFPAVDRRMLTSDDPIARKYCHELATVARGAGYAGLLVPSAALAGGVNLVVYPDAAPPARVDMEVGPHRSLLRQRAMA